MKNGYTKKRQRGFLDQHQIQVKHAYRNLIRYTIRHNAGLNISQIAKKIIEVRSEWQKLAKEIPDNIKSEVIKGEPQRKTITQHLDDMLNQGEIELVRNGYVATGMHLTESSKGINQSVVDLLSSKYLIERNFTHAGNVGACYISSKPNGSHEKFYDLLNSQIQQFGDSIFWLDDIVKHAILKNHISPEFYSKKKNKLNMIRLIEGLSNYFGDNELFILAFAINPPNLLEFLRNPMGNSLASKYLQGRWSRIVELAELEHKRRSKLIRKGVGKI
jgi:hypothetical protein